jgi:AcrR family transcriptional regulator
MVRLCTKSPAGGCAKVAGTSARERILRAAAHLYALHGFQGASVREIAEAAGVTKPLVLYHFESKEKLFATLLREAVGGCICEAEQIAARPESAAERLRELVRFQAAQARLAPEVMVFAYEVLAMPGLPPLGYDYRAQGRRLFQVFVGLIEEGQRRGEFRPIDAAVIAAIPISAIGLYAAAVLSGDVEGVPHDLGDSLCEVLMQGVEARHS